MTETLPQDGTIRDGVTVEGKVEWVLRGPDGKVKESGRAFNTITRIGDQRLGEGGVGIAGAPAVPNGMKLGAGSTAPAKVDPGASLTTYLANSHVAIGTPTSGLQGAVRRITFTATWAAGKATTASAITEAVIVNDYAAGTDATSTAANTLSRVLLSPAIGSKGANDTLTVTWTWDVGT